MGRGGEGEGMDGGGKREGMNGGGERENHVSKHSDSLD